MEAFKVLFQNVCFIGGLVAASPPGEHTRRIGSNSLGTFLNPAAVVRPRYRYWYKPSRKIRVCTSKDIAELGARGAGGIQFLNYYNYRGSSGSAATDWNIYGYGTSVYREVLKAGTQRQLSSDGFLNGSIVSNNATIVDGSYSGQLPGWGRGDLVSAVTLAVYNATNKTDNPRGAFGWYFQRNYTEYLISAGSLTEVADLVHDDGSITTAVSPVEGAQFYFLYASYAQRSYARACVASSPDTQNILRNGSLAVDHFSDTGARVGNYVWEDSVEIPSYTYWTPALPQLFEHEHNEYSITKYLPLLAGNEGYISTLGGPVQFITDSNDTDAGVIADFRSTLSNGLFSYLHNLTSWPKQFLGLQFSQQVGYNLPVDTLQLIPDVDAPETETLGFSNTIDGFRQFCGPANLAWKSVISIELGADIIRTYIQTWSDVLSEANRAFVAGVNQMSIHGAIYSHEYANTTWPGYTSFQYLFSGQHYHHQPAWDVGYKQANDYLARVQFVLQSGSPKVDIAFWDKQTAQNSSIPSLYQSDDLVRKGYTYTYLSPENFELDAAYVEDGVLAPLRQQLKALIIRENDTMTVAGVKHLQRYAKAGLPIILSGAIPSPYASSDKDAIQSSKETMKELFDLENVHQVQVDTFAEFLGTIGIHPRTQIEGNGTWHTIWTEFPNSDVYVFIYNEDGYSTGNITFATTGAPYLLNPWTGGQTPIFEYSDRIFREVGITQIKRSSSSQPRFHTWVASTEGPPSLTLAWGNTIELSTQLELASSFSLSNWTITVEQWLPPSDIFNVEIVANKSNVTTTVSGSQLSSWSDLNLTTSSGVGYYTSSFTWSLQANETGAYLVVPPAQQGIVGLLNDKELPSIDIANPTVDVAQFLVDGVNTVTLKTSTTLWDTLLPIWSSLRTGGGAPEFPAEAVGYGHSQNGIIGEVQIIPYKLVKVH
ncbi:hypothetical protein M434DRAFT_27444 [Hypoxylon sp. CO27-5]|nr:hypothetical protein M434DRAFT_27444 [Hypoxylon sp. CO27-5]